MYILHIIYTLYRQVLYHTNHQHLWRSTPCPAGFVPGVRIMSPRLHGLPHVAWEEPRILVCKAMTLLSWQLVPFSLLYPTEPRDTRILSIET